MNNNVKIIFAFTLGAAAGVAATWQFFKKKYEQIAQEEIDSVKEVYSKRLNTLDKCREVYSLRNQLTKEKDTKEKYIPTEEDKETFDTLKKRYTGESYIGEKGGTEDMKDYIEVIPPDEYGYNGDNDEYIDYDLLSFTYYANGVLADDGDFPIENVEAVIGPDALDSFGEWEDDRVFVRNDDRKCYYEICRDLDDYSGPQVENE